MKNIRLLNTIKNIDKFNFGVTSYVYPEDIIPNIMTLADRVDEIELILFEGKDYSNLPDKNTIDNLNKLSIVYGIKYNIHFPIDIKIIDDSPEKREFFYNCIERVYNLTLEIDPISYTLHIDPFEEKIYQNIKDELFIRLKKIFNSDIPVCIENLDNNFDLFIKDFIENGFYVCLDIGHMILLENNISEYIEKYGKYTRIIHLHGVDLENKDHQNIEFLGDKELRKIIELAKNQDCSVILEQFSFENIKKSIDIIRSYYGKHTHNWWC